VTTLAPVATIAQEPPALVQTNVVTREPIRQTVPIIGRIVAMQSGTVAAKTGGPVVEVLVNIGSRAEPGDVVARLADDLPKAELRRIEADRRLQRAKIGSAQARLDLALQELARLEKLKGTSAFPRASFDDKTQEIVRYRSELAEQRAGSARVDAAIAIARIELDRAIVRAPYAGVVTTRLVSAGAYVRAGDPIVRMVDDGALEVEVDVPSAKLTGLSTGDPLSLELEDGTRHEATIRAIVPNENPLTRTRQVRLTPRFDNLRQPLAANQSAIAMVPVGTRREVTSVHKDAVIASRGQSIVYVVNEDVVAVRPVKLGDAIGSRFVVLQGLEPGEIVVVRGNERLRPGQNVRTEKAS
jgi:RND family efflux transporter MFP subunit